jgi:hypothetical protein
MHTIQTWYRLVLDQKLRSLLMFNLSLDKADLECRTLAEAIDFGFDWDKSKFYLTESPRGFWDMIHKRALNENISLRKSIVTTEELDQEDLDNLNII